MGRKAWFLAFVTALLAGCASHYAPNVISDPYGFFSGIWHGMLFPWALMGNVISWLASIFELSVFELIQIVGRPNTGLWYYVGFAIGFFAYGGA